MIVVKKCDESKAKLRAQSLAAGVVYSPVGNSGSVWLKTVNGYLNLITNTHYIGHDVTVDTFPAARVVLE